MSELIRTLNHIKSRCDYSWLTSSQLSAFRDIEGILSVPGTVNLVGPVGAGKTFLAWIAMDNFMFSYVAHPSQIVATESFWSEGLLVDNCSPRRPEHRQTLLSLSAIGVKKAVLISRNMIQDYTHYVQLSLTEDDVRTVQQNLANIGIASRNIGVENLWQLINPFS